MFALPNQIVLFRVPTSHLFSQFLIKIVLYHDIADKNAFVAISECDDEVSVLMDRDLFHAFCSEYHDERMSVAPEIWRALPFRVGSNTLMETGFTQKFAQPLTEAGVGVFYLSTFEAELLLVDEKDLQTAEDALASTVEGHTASDTNNNDSSNKNRSSSTSSVDDRDKNEKNCSIMEGRRVRMVGFKSHLIPALSYSLLKAMFYPVNRPRFFSFVRLGEDISMTMDLEALSLFSEIEGFTICEGIWKVLQLDADFAQIGIVSALSRPLAAAGLPLLYMSSYSTDYAMILEEQTSLVLECLQKDHTWIVDTI